MSAAAIDVRKAVAYAVLESAGDRIAARKAVAYAVLDASVAVSVRKALAYAVLHDPSVDTSLPPSGAGNLLRGVVQGLVRGVVRDNGCFVSGNEITR